jgi:hypothetical protein
MSMATLPVACAPSTLATHRADGLDVLDDADLVVHQQDGHEDRVLAQRVLELVEVDEAVFLHVEVAHLEALALEFTHGVEHGLVLGLQRDEVLAAAAVEVGRALDGEVDGLGGAAGPDDFARVGVDQPGHLGTRLLHRFFRLPAPGMAAAGRVAEVFTQPRDHGVDHTRVAGRGGTVVEIDREMRGHRRKLFSVFFTC